MLKRLPKEYLDDILVRLAHHSSALEGNTITLVETISIILYNQVSSNRSIDLREIYEIKNHEQALHYLLETLTANEPLHLQIVKEIHALLMDRLQYDRGQFKSVENAILGVDFMTASVQETPLLMQRWVDNLNYRLDLTVSAQEKIGIIAEAHITFERIHPFADGNGRTGRMLLNYSLLERGLALSSLTVKIKRPISAFLLNKMLQASVNSLKRRWQKNNNACNVLRIKSNNKSP